MGCRDLFDVVHVEVVEFVEVEARGRLRAPRQLEPLARLYRGTSPIRKREVTLHLKQDQKTNIVHKLKVNSRTNPPFNPPLLLI